MRSNILIVVEGNKTESQFFKQLLSVFNLKFDVYCLGANIYTLYKGMKGIEFNGDLKDVLAEMHPDKKQLLSKKFAYTYLVFDCDAHHPKKDDSRSIREIVFDNFSKLEEMSKYFVDETNPSVGRLYINYPMMESYRDCDDFFEDKYSTANVPIEQIVHYKESVAKRKLSGIHVDTFTQKQFSQLILQNIYKLNKICCERWDKLGYEDYRLYSDSAEVLKRQKKLVEVAESISVINTSLFMITDFYGNRDGFYDSLKK